MRSRHIVLAAVVSVLFSVWVLALSEFAETQDPTNPPGSTSSYTLEDIYQRLTTGNYFTQSTFSEPGSGPGTGTMHTVNDIWGVARPGATTNIVPKTGDTYDDPCCTGEDGETQYGIEWVKISSAGTQGAYTISSWTGVRFTDNGDGTVTDNLTGLIWLKNAYCFVIMRDWSTALSYANGLASGSCGLTDGSSAGDWRLPNVNELHSLIDLTQSYPALPAGHPFTGVQSHIYWSSTTRAVNPDHAWSVDMSSGFVLNFKKNIIFYVWPVRGGE